MKYKIKDRRIDTFGACNSIEFNFNINCRTFRAMREKPLLIFASVISRDDKSRVYYRPQYYSRIPCEKKEKVTAPIL